MPYIKMPECEKQNHSVIAAIKYGMTMYDVSSEQLALAMRKDRMTLYRRMKRPGDFTLDELRSVSTKLHIPLEKLVKGETQ